MSKTYNLYCDESCHLENDNHSHMLLGYISVPYNQIDIHKSSIKRMCEMHKLYAEIKWSKISGSKERFYFDLIDYFFATDLRFRAVIVEKSNINNDAYVQDFNTFYHKMYYQLIHHKLDLEPKYNIYLDIKDTLSAQKLRKLKEILQVKYNRIYRLQHIRSHESVFLQLADFMIGAIGYHARGLEGMEVKRKIIDRIIRKSGQSLEHTSFLNEEKFNLFFIDLS